MERERRRGGTRRLWPAMALGVLLAVVVGCGGQTTQVVATPAPTPVASEDNRPRVTFDDERLQATLQRILTDSPEEATAGELDLLAPGLELIKLTRDPRFVPVLVDMLGIPPYSLIYRRHTGDVLDALTGEDIGVDWFTWVERVAGHSEMGAPPLYGWWKGEILSQIDPRFKDFLPNDDVLHTIRLEEIVWGGVGVDAIPALDHPTFISPAEATYLTPDEQVFGVSINGDARAYPLRIMNWHEMANDTVGGVPVSLAYCTLCNSAILFNTSRDVGEPFSFHTSGLLYRSNKLMYDAQTKSLWNQFTGQPAVGPLVQEDVRLDILPVTQTSWEEWLTEHPETTVLSLNTGYDRDYLKPGTEGAPYSDYFAGPSLLFPSGERDTERVLKPKDRVFVLTTGTSSGDEEVKAYALDLLQERGVVNDLVGETPVVLVMDAGGGVRAYERRNWEFRLTDGPTLTLEDAEGRPWQPAAEVLRGPEGQELRRLSGHVSFWFAYRSFRPRAPLYAGE